jgi:hypothetical protein
MFIGRSLRLKFGGAGAQTRCAAALGISVAHMSRIVGGRGTISSTLRAKLIEMFGRDGIDGIPPCMNYRRDEERYRKILKLHDEYRWPWAQVAEVVGGTAGSVCKLGITARIYLGVTDPHPRRRPKPSTGYRAPHQSCTASAPSSPIGADVT